MATKVVIGPNDAQTVVELSEDEEAQRVLDEQAGAAYLSARQALRERFAEFANDANRREYVDKLTTATNEQIETFVRSRLNIDGVTDLASAKQALKRMETAFVVVMKVLALMVPKPPPPVALKAVDLVTGAPALGTPELQ